MSDLSDRIAKPHSRPGQNLLDRIRSLHDEVGDSLNEEEFTRFLRQTELPGEYGFSFLSYCERFATLSVPHQQTGDWYQETGWVSAEKERIAKGIGKKYGLSLCEPPDIVYPGFNSPAPHHHLELTNLQETIIIVHPQFLKIRMFSTTTLKRNVCIAQKPIPFGPDLLQDLAFLYQSR